ncbi:DNA-binding MarR family transcriptional regulator [Motilibacter rhizosphaerae]|uniref:DNA-binding MarR family transcriptional regulator n=1 Tax=Motilibacter rhizosphaerae TaxID=598652 RepID=A0A4Q7NZC1_9ACTN|nr:MarR family transcriptional regulator [Motilibacter rhizosphaerae]RZS91782.1 DNA-binding MarR family transcriptional regulator [Motilibacter rhizosphaerae]
MAAGTGAAVGEDLLGQWRALSERCSRVNEALDRELTSGYRLGRTDYEVLARLDEDEHSSGRVTELADAVGLSQSAMSRLVDRLQGQGLVERACCETDRRGVFVSLTPAGRARVSEARPAYTGVLERMLGEG